MTDYSKGKIYKIIDNTNGKIYIGSTVQTLQGRLLGHKTEYKNKVISVPIKAVIAVIAIFSE